MEKRLLFTEAQIREKLIAVGNQINEDYKGRQITLIGVLKGAFIFMADLVRYLKVPVEIDFIRLSSYRSGTERCQSVDFTKDIELDLTGKDVILVEDIVDTGQTIVRFKEIVRSKNPSSIKICALISKKERREIDINIDYACFEVSQGFLVGYGLDYDEKGRELPEIYTLASS